MLGIRLTYITDRVSHRGRGAPGISPQPQKSLDYDVIIASAVYILRRLSGTNLSSENNLPTFRLLSSFRLSSSG